MREKFKYILFEMDITPVVYFIGWLFVVFIVVMWVLWLFLQA